NLASERNRASSLPPVTTSALRSTSPLARYSVAITAERPCSRVVPTMTMLSLPHRRGGAPAELAPLLRSTSLADTKTHPPDATPRVGAACPSTQRPPSALAPASPPHPPPP